MSLDPSRTARCNGATRPAQLRLKNGSVGPGADEIYRLTQAAKWGPVFDSVQLVNRTAFSLWFMDVYGTYGLTWD